MLETRTHGPPRAKLHFVRTVRILLLVLLAVLLPVRGALAGAGHCAGSPDAVVQVVAAAQAHSDAHAHGGHGAAPADAVHAAHHASPAGGEDLSASADPCTLCTATCSATPFLGEPVAMPMPLAAAGTSFPALAAPPSCHATEGPERPPRSA